MPQQSETVPCRHRGDQVSTISCESCGESFTVPVYDCQIHGECTPDPNREAVRPCTGCRSYARPGDDSQERIILHSNLSPGDITVLTAAVKALHDNHPGRYLVDVRTPCPALWEHSPLVCALADDAGRHVDVHYHTGRWATIHHSNQRPAHFVQAYCEGLADALGIAPFAPRNWLEPSIVLTEQERHWIPRIDGDYWVINAGIKRDFTAKLWNGYQELVNLTRERIHWVQIGSPEHDHQPLQVVTSLIGETDLRQLVRLVYHARGVVCGVTALAHLAHWVQRKDGRPRHAAIIAGGRESPHWFAYPGQQIFHTIGQLPCCETGGCWRSRVVPLDVDPHHNASLCERPVGAVGQCMASIDPAEVAHCLGRILQCKF